MCKNMNRCFFIILLMLFVCGCVTAPTTRAVQGFSNSCALHALVNAIEIQTHKSFSGNERWKVWKKYGSWQGITFYRAMDAAIRSKWIPENSWLRITNDINLVNYSPLLCVVRRHAITLISRNGNSVMYIDPLYVDPREMSVDDLFKLTNGFFYKLEIQ